MKVANFLIIILSLCLLACNPYKGFKGVDDKGMGRKPPSVKMTDSFKKNQKKSDRQMKKEIKKRQKKYGSPATK